MHFEDYYKICFYDNFDYQRSQNLLDAKFGKNKSALYIQRNPIGRMIEREIHDHFEYQWNTMVLTMGKVDKLFEFN